MRRAAVLLLLLAFAPAARAGEGVYITIDGGYAFWQGKDAMKTKLTPQVGAANASTLVDNQLPDGGLFAMHLGYNIAGHVAFEGSFAIHPWEVLENDRGAVGFVGLAARWYPLQGLIKPNRQFDFSLLTGVDHFLMGANGVIPAGQSDPLPNSGRGLDGMAFEFGATVELYLARWVSVGLTPRLYELAPQRYFTDYNNRDTGGQTALDNNIGGGLFSLTLSLTFHFEPQPD